LFFTPAKAENNKIELKLFYGNGCPQCGLEREFLKEIKTKYQDQIFFKSMKFITTKKMLKFSVF
jgi:glutaredoxin-related protein